MEKYKLSSDNESYLYEQKDNEMKEKTDELLIREYDKQSVDVLMETHEGVNKMKTIGPEIIYEKCGLNYIF